MLPATYVCTTFFPYLNLSNIATTFGRRKLAQFSRVCVFGKTNFKLQRILFSLQKHLWKKHLWKKLSNERKSRRSPFTIFLYSYVIYASRINELINSKYFPLSYSNFCQVSRRERITFSYLSDIAKLLSD